MRWFFSSIGLKDRDEFSRLEVVRSECLAAPLRGRVEDAALGLLGALADRDVPGSNNLN